MMKYCSRSPKKKRSLDNVLVGNDDTRRKSTSYCLINNLVLVSIWFALFVFHDKIRNSSSCSIISSSNPSILVTAFNLAPGILCVSKSSLSSSILQVAPTPSLLGYNNNRLFRKQRDECNNNNCNNNVRKAVNHPRRIQPVQVAGSKSTLFATKDDIGHDNDEEKVLTSLLPSAKNNIASSSASSSASASASMTTTTQTSLWENINVILFRTSFIVSTCAFSLKEIFIPILLEATGGGTGGSGLSMETMDYLEISSMNVSTWGIICTSLIIPKYKQQPQLQQQQKQNRPQDDDQVIETVEIIRKSDFDISNNIDNENNNTSQSSWMTFINDLLPIFAISGAVVKLIAIMMISSGSLFEKSASIAVTAAVTTAVTSPTSSTTISLLDPMINGILVSALCIREIGYFGYQYKVEAIVALGVSLFSTIMKTMMTTTTIAIDTGTGTGTNAPSLISGLSGIYALCLLVLSFGKLFEPIEDELETNGSNFFNNNNNNNK